MNRSTIKTLTLFLACSVVLQLVNGCASKPESKVPREPQAVGASVFIVEQKSVPGTFVAVGSLRTKFKSVLASKVTGRIDSVSIREGDTVAANQLLVSIDPREVQAGLAMARADLDMSRAGVGVAQSTALLEDKISAAKVKQAEAQVSQAKAALASAEAKRDLALAGPRQQEVDQSHIAVVQAESSLKFAKIELDRTSRLVDQGVLARRELEFAQNRYDVAKGQFDNAVQAESMAREGTRTQELRASQEAVAQAKATVKQAEAGLQQAIAGRLTVDVREREVRAAQSRLNQSKASAAATSVTLTYCKVRAPFEGRVVKRLVDPGSLATIGAPLLEIEGGPMRIEVTVPERLIDHIKLGDVMTVRLDGLGDRSFDGRVSELVPQASGTSHSFIVRLDVENRGGLKSGMFGRVHVPTPATVKILVPIAAVVRSDGLDSVIVIDGSNTARMRIVTLGADHEGFVEVLSGLKPGEKVVSDRRLKIEDGQPVVPRQ